MSDPAIDAQPVWADERVRRGMERQLAARAERLRAGASPVGWKLGLGAAAARELHGISAAVVGHLLDDGVVGDGRRSIGAWVAPRLEAEIAVHLGAPVVAPFDEDAVRSAVAGLSLAIELADIGAGGDIEAIVATNIFHRAVVIGAPRAAPERLPTVEVVVDGEPFASVTDLAGPVGGSWHELTGLVARCLDAFGLGLAAGDVIITGSVVPLIEVAPGEHVDVHAEGFSSVSVALTA